MELWCYACKEKRDTSWKEGVCQIPTCLKNFKSSAYWFKMKKTDFPTMCSKCRLADRQSNRLAILEGGLNESERNEDEEEDVNESDF